MKLHPDLGPRVTIERIRELFGNSGPFTGEVWESQFDGGDDELRQLARTPWEELFNQSFWVYFHDLTYVDLQPELFHYLFPACLVMAQQRLMAGLYGIASGDSDFLNALSKRNWYMACTSGQVQGTHQILIDGFIDRLDVQKDFSDPAYEFDLEDPVSRYNWIDRFNSMGYILPSIGPLWHAWWSMDTPGKAVAALEYVWSLAAPDEVDVEEAEMLIPLWSRPSVEPDGSIYLRGWEAANLEFLATTLNHDYLLRKARLAVDELAGMPDEAVAKRILEQVRDHRELTEGRIVELIKELATPR